jgi:hypothetical protein
MATGLQGGVCFIIAITSSIFLIGPRILARIVENRETLHSSLHGGVGGNLVFDEVMTRMTQAAPT